MVNSMKNNLSYKDVCNCPPTIQLIELSFHNFKDEKYYEREVEVTKCIRSRVYDVGPTDELFIGEKIYRAIYYSQFIDERRAFVRKELRPSFLKQQYRTGSLWTRKNTVAGCVMTVRFPIPLGMLTKMRARKDPSISGIVAHYPAPASGLIKERSTFCLIRNWDYPVIRMSRYFSVSS